MTGTTPPPNPLMASATDPSRAFGMVPVWITRHPELSPGAVRLYALLAALYVTRPGFTAPAPTLVGLAVELAVTERTVRTWRDELLAVRALAVVKRPNRPTIYVVAGVEAPGPLSENPFTAGGDGVEAPFHTDRKPASTPTTTTENSDSSRAEMKPRADERPAYRPPAAPVPWITPEAHTAAVGAARRSGGRRQRAPDHEGRRRARGRGPGARAGTGRRRIPRGQRADRPRARTVTPRPRAPIKGGQVQKRGALPRRQSRWRCHACQVIHTSYAAAQRHADDHTHGRIELVL